MEIDIDVYFWMVDRGVFEDDQRNKVDIDRNKVRLQREHAQRFENAFYVAKLMLVLKKSIIKISKQPFSIDPNLQSLKDNVASHTKQTNWNLVAKELKRFGIKIDAEKKQKIIEGRYQYICDILSKLFDFDNGGGVHTSRFHDGNNSDINYGAAVGTGPRERDNSFIANNDQQQQLLPQNSNISNQQHMLERDDSLSVSLAQPITTNQNSQTLIKKVPSKKGVLEPIEGTSKGKQQLLYSPQKSIHQNSSSVNISSVSSSKTLQLQQLKPNNQQMLKLNPSMTSIAKQKNTTFSSTQFDEINLNKDVSEADTTLEFILMSLAKNLQIKTKQAAGLLSDNHKYLMHIAVKGMKGGDFIKINNWFQDLYANSEILVSLIEQEKEQNAMSTTLNIVKCGMFSSNLDTAIACSRVLQKIGKDINEVGGELTGLAWDWFINNQNSYQQQQNDIENNLNNLKVPSLVNNGNEQPLQENNNINQQSPLELGDSGLSSQIYVMKRHPQDFLEHSISVMLEFGKHNYFELFTHHLPLYYQQSNLNQQYDNQNLQNNDDGFQNQSKYPNNASSFIELIHDILAAVGSTSIGKEALVTSGALENLIDLSLRLADNDGQQNLSTQRISALSFLVALWEIRPEVIEINGGDSTAQAILTVLKRGCRDRNKLLKTTSCELMFKLVHMFANERNQYAPIVYRSLTFLLIEFHNDIKIREQMMSHFTTLFNQIQTMPCAILCEPLLKQIQINDGQQYQYNVFDFDFFKSIISHKKVTLNIALQIAEEMARICQNDIFFANAAIFILLNIINRFKKEANLHQTFNQIFKQALSVIEQQEHQRQKIEEEKNKKQNQSPNQNNSKKQQSIQPDLKATLSRYQLKKQQEMEKQKQLEDEQQYESLRLAMKTKERLIVNMFKKIIVIGQNEMLKQDIRMQLLGTYTSIERAIKVHSKPINYLLNLFGEDLAKMLQYYVQVEKQVDDQKQLAIMDHSQQEIEQQKQINPYLNLNTVDVRSDSMMTNEQDKQMVLYNSDVNSQGLHTNRRGVSLPKSIQPNKTTKLQELAQKDIEKVKITKLERSHKKTMEDEIKRLKVETNIKNAQMKVEQRKNVLGVPSKFARNISVDQNDLQLKDGQLMIAQVSNEEIEDEQRLLAGMEDNDNSFVSQTQVKQTKNAHKLQLMLYDIRNEEQKDQDAVRFFIQKHIKILKNLFTTYSNSGPINNNAKTFDALQDKLRYISVAELNRLLKDFQVLPTLLPSINSDDVLTITRLINMEILKKKIKNSGSGQGQLSVLDFEGFVEFILQIAVMVFEKQDPLLYRTPVEYLQQLFEYFKKSSSRQSLSSAKLFQDEFSSAIGDPDIIRELQKRIDINPQIQLPEGYQKVLEKDMVLTYNVPDTFTKVLGENKKICIELLDEIVFKKFNMHFLEPMSQIKTQYRIKPLIYKHNQTLNQSNNSIIDSQAQPSLIKKYITAAKDSQNQQIRSRQVKGNYQVSQTLDKSNEGENMYPYNKLSKQNMSKNQKSTQSLTLRNISASPSKRNKQDDVKEVRPVLGVNLKIEVAKAKKEDRDHVLETAYVVEELIMAVEQGLLKLPERQKLVKQRIINRVMEERFKKQQDDILLQKEQVLKIEARKQKLRQQLDLMNKDKEDKIKLTAELKKKQEQDEKNKEKKALEQKTKHYQQVHQDLEKKRSTKNNDEEQKKRDLELQQKLQQDLQKKESNKILKKKNKEISEIFKKQAEEKKKINESMQEEKKKKEEKEKRKFEQIKQKYNENIQKAKEQKEKKYLSYINFLQQPDVRFEVFQKYDKSLQTMYEQYCKFEKNFQIGGHMSYNAYIKMGSQTKLSSQMLSSGDYIYVYKTVMRSKVDLEKGNQQDNLSGLVPSNTNIDVTIDSSNLDFKEFVECMIKIAYLARFKLGGVTQKDNGQDYNTTQQQNSLQYEKEFDFENISSQTLVSLFKFLGLQPNKNVQNPYNNQTLNQSNNYDGGNFNENNDLLA